MPAVRDVGAIARKWARVTPQRTEDYLDGVKNPRRDWAESTANAEDNYKAGVTKAANEGRFGRGVRSAGSEKWRKQAIAKGQARFGEGVALGEQDFAAGFEPFRQVIESTKIPPRFPKGDPRNLERVKVLSEALHKKRISG